MSVVEEIRNSCGCTMTFAHDGDITLRRCNSAKGAPYAARLKPDCDLGDQTWNDLDVMVRPLQELFRWGGGLEHKT